MFVNWITHKNIIYVIGDLKLLTLYTYKWHQLQNKLQRAQSICIVHDWMLCLQDELHHDAMPKYYAHQKCVK